MVDKYKSTKCIDHLFGHAAKRKTRAATDRLIQGKLRLDRGKSASTVEAEIEKSLHIDAIRKRAHEVGSVARKKPSVNKINQENRHKFDKKILEKSVDFWKNVV